MPTCWGLAVFALVLSPHAHAEVKVDLYGDPLPQGALARLGTLRMRTPASIRVVALSPDGKTLLSDGLEDRIVCWDTATGKKAREWPRVKRHYEFLRFRPDGRTVFAKSYDGAVRLLDAETGAEVWSFPDAAKPGAYGVAALSPDGKTVVVSCQGNRQLVIWDVAAKAVKHRVDNVVTTASDAVTPVFTPDGKHFVALWTDHRPHLIDAATGKSVRCLAEGARADRDPKRSVMNLSS